MTGLSAHSLTQARRRGAEIRGSSITLALPALITGKACAGVEMPASSPMASSSAGSTLQGIAPSRVKMEGPALARSASSLTQSSSSASYLPPP